MGFETASNKAYMYLQLNIKKHSSVLCSLTHVLFEPNYLNNLLTEL